MSIDSGGFCFVPLISILFVYRNLLGENKRDTVNIVIPDVEPSILKKVVEYIYFGTVELEPKFMAGKNPLKLMPPLHIQTFLSSRADFIEACNLLQLKATITCERKLVFDQKLRNPAAFFAKPSTSTPVSTSTPKSRHLESLMSQIDADDSQEYMKEEQIDDSAENVVEVYEISNMQDEDISYEDGDDSQMYEESYELMNVTDIKSEGIDVKPKIKFDSSKAQRPRAPPKPVDEELMKIAIQEVISNANRYF